MKAIGILFSPGLLTLCFLTPPPNPEMSHGISCLWKHMIMHPILVFINCTYCSKSYRPPFPKLPSALQSLPLPYFPESILYILRKMKLCTEGLSISLTHPKMRLGGHPIHVFCCLSCYQPRYGFLCLVSNRLKILCSVSHVKHSQLDFW